MQKMNGKWLVGVSGGPDSMALLDMCMQSGMDCAAAHVNYHHRSSADAEEAYVRTYCTAHNIACYVRREPFVYQGNFEAAAREWRYDFFASIVQEYGFTGVLIAHQEDDLIETYMMQEDRNIVPAFYGLKEENLYHGMRVVRPLLSYTKQDLEQYCIDHHIHYCIDETNKDTSLSRNKVRFETVAQMNRFERDMIHREIDQKNAQRKERICRVKTMIQMEKVSLVQYRHLEEADRLELARMIIAPEIQEHRLSLAHMKEIDHILCTKDDFVIPAGRQNIVQDHGWFFLHEKYLPYVYTVHDIEHLLALGQQPCFGVEDGAPGIYAVTLFPSDYPLIIRNFHDGDAIELRYGRKSAARFFIDRKIPRYLRSGWPVVCDSSGKIILVPGIGCDVVHFSDRPTVNVVQYPLIKEK